MSVCFKLPTKPLPLAAMTQSIAPTYDAPTEEDLRALSGYDVVFLVDDVVSKTLRSTWTDVGPAHLSTPLAPDSRLRPKKLQKILRRSLTGTITTESISVSLAVTKSG